VSSSAAPIASDQAGAGLGGLHIATGPASHSRLLRFTYVGMTTHLEGFSDEALPIAEVSVSRRFQPDSIQILVNESPCDGPVDVVADVEVDVVAEVSEFNVCRIYVDFTHALGKVNHPEHGPIMGAVVIEGATVVFQPLDPDLGAPVEVVAGPTGVEAMEFVPGRYEVTASLHGEVLITQQVDLRQTPDIVLDLMALAPSVPRTCNFLDPITCEKAIRAAMSYGTWISPTDTVTAVSIQRTTVGSCDPYIDPKLDVAFDLAPDGHLDVTVGTHTNNGRWIACSPY
jgi:hypothetical protein